MSEATMWTLLAIVVLILASPFLLFLWGKMWASGNLLGRAKARQKIRNDNLNGTNNHERKR